MKFRTFKTFNHDNKDGFFMFIKLSLIYSFHFEYIIISQVCSLDLE